MSFALGTLVAPNTTWSTYGSPASAARVTYVSSSVGNDANSGRMVGGVISPLATQAAAIAQFKADVTAGFDAWLLFREGDSWTGILTNSWGTTKGSSSTSPIVVSSYHESVLDISNTFATPFPRHAARPKFNVANGTVWVSADPGTQINNAVFSGLWINGYQHDPNDAGYTATSIGNDTFAFSMQGAEGATPITFLLWEGCKCSFMDKFVSLLDGSGASGGSGVIARRNTIIDGYQGGNANFANGNKKRGVQGFFNAAMGWSLYENVIDNIGRNTSLGTGKSVTISNDGTGHILVTWPDKFFPRQADGVSGVACQIAFTSTGGNITAGNTYETGTSYMVLANVNTAGPYTFTIANAAGTAIAYAGTEVSPQTAYWVDMRGNEFSHPYYWSDMQNTANAVTASSGTFQGNIFSNSPSGGKSGCGLQYVDNALLSNGWNTNFGAIIDNSPYNVTHNVALDSRDFSAWNGGIADLWDTLGPGSATQEYAGQLNWNDNIHANASCTNTNGYTTTATTHVTISNEIVFNWGASLAQLTQFDSAPATYVSNKFDPTGTNSNSFPDPFRTAGSYYATLAGSTANATFTGAITGFASGSGTLTISGITGAVAIGDAVTWSGQANAVVIKAFGTGSGGNGTYTVGCLANQASISMSSYTTQQFINAARGSDAAGFDATLTANALNNYIRAGFGVADYPSSVHHGGNKLGKF